MVMGHHSPCYQWDMHKHNMFLPIPIRAREQVSALGCGTGTYHVTSRPESPEYGSRPRAGPIGQDFRDLGVCLRRYTAD